MSIRIGVKNPNEELKIIEVEEGFRGNTAEKYIDGYIQYIGLDGGKRLLNMAVDEDGLAKELETNFFLSTNINLSERIVGTVVFCRHRYVNVFEEEIYDYALENLTDDDIEHIKKMLKEDYQNRLKTIYETRGSKSYGVKFWDF